MSLRDGREPDDVVSFGSDVPRSTTWRWIWVAVGCLVLGFFAGGEVSPRDDEEADSSGSTAGAALPVAAGAISNVPAAKDPADFQLAVFNTGDVEAKVTIVNLGGAEAFLPFSSSTTIPPGSWGMVVFSARPECDDPASATLDEVGLWVRSSVEQHTTDVRVFDARAWTDYYNAWCAEPAPIRPDQLAGVWIVDKVYGRFAELEGAHLLRFNPDGTYAVDYKGGLFSSSPHFYGTYRLHSASLRATAHGGDGFIKGGDRCNATERLELRIRPDARLSLASTRGPCHDGSVWIAHRVLHNVGLPQPAGTAARAP